ncbi:hypothetical protein BASA62_006474 [Batrachochytrium salamandrivorans]|nr:hypothetical protein BASA62_006474 [Batrachochytrium salamandrivorans]
MKLISFAVISFLAITVSAHPGLGTSAATDAPQCDKDVITQKIQELTTAYQEQQELITKLETPGKAEQEEREIRSVIKTIEKQLKKKDLSEDERWDLQNHYAESVDDLKKAESALIPKKQQLDEAGGQRYCIEVKLNLLEETLKRKTEQDAKSKDRTGVSPGSSSYKDILQSQIDETFHDASDLSASNQGINEGISKLDDVIKRTKDPKISKLDKTWDKLTGIRKKLMIESDSMQDQYFHTKELQSDFNWPSQNSLARQSKKPHWRTRQNYRHRRPDQLRPTAPPPPLSRQILAVNVANISNKRPAIRHIVRNTRFWAISETCITSSKFRFTVPGFATERGEVSKPRKIFEEDRIVEGDVVLKYPQK